ncbi:hypothetical protein [Saccharothrix sp. NRRL B-16314]|uniref:hypothetical protein n=1 Tax=Saccharothrix sp. NRRL B-16314 TaxID=1463825 RepID=UPI0012DBCE7A|nr:hypothetical protein [Saccharothrix sp. NRRL B-16314]
MFRQSSSVHMPSPATVRHLPGLIGELSRARQLLTTADRRHVSSLLTLALRAADGAAYKYRNHPQVRQALSVLLRTNPSLSSGLLDLAAWAGAR